MSFIITNYGQDIRIGKVVSLESGTKNLVTALVRRLSTAKGSLFYDPDYGNDVRIYINAEIDDQILQQIETDVENQMEQDERVRSTKCTATFNKSTMSLKLEVQVTPFIDGRSFTLIISVNQLSVKLLNDSINQG